MELDARVYKAATDLERLMYEMAHQEINENTEELFGEPPSFNKESANYEPGNSPDLEKIKATLENYLLY